MTQHTQTRRTRPHSGDIWLQWPDTYRPGCPSCGQPTIGLVDQGAWVAGSLRIKTVAEPCGHDVTTFTQAMLAQAREAGTLDSA